MNELTINRPFFLKAFGRDPMYAYNCGEQAYLNIETGEMLWVYLEPGCAEFEFGIPLDFCREYEQELEANRESYLRIPPTSHEEHHQILMSFLYSDWTDDKERLDRAQCAYHSSIGKWIRDVDDPEVVALYYRYRDAFIAEQAEEFLREKGIEPNWK